MICATRDLVPGTAANALRWILSEAKKGTKSIGFVPLEGLERASRAGRVHIAFENDDPVAFCVWGPSRSRLVIRLYQVWTRNDARRLTHATAILEQIAQLGAARGAVELACWCAQDLEATIFWASLGFTENALRPGGRGRVHVNFVRPIKRGRPLLALSPGWGGHGKATPKSSPLVGVQAGGTALRRLRPPCDHQRRLL